MPTIHNTTNNQHKPHDVNDARYYVVIARYDVAKIFGSKFSLISPVWLQVLGKYTFTQLIVDGEKKHCHLGKMWGSWFFTRIMINQEFVSTEYTNKQLTRWQIITEGEC